MKIVLDTNIIMSATLFGGQPLKVVELLRNDVQAYASPEIIAEYNITIERLVQKYPNKELKMPLDDIIKILQVKKSHSHIEVCRDPKDNMFLECAVDNKCIYIVSGDKDLLVLEKYEDVEILTVAQFLERYYG